MNDARKTKAQLIEELDGLRGENTDLREKVAGVDVSGVERQLTVERVRAEAMAMRSSDDLHGVGGVLHQQLVKLGYVTIATITYLDRDTGQCSVSVASQTREPWD